jgi:hypothetical protein
MPQRFLKVFHQAASLAPCVLVANVACSQDASSDGVMTTDSNVPEQDMANPMASGSATSDATETSEGGETDMSAEPVGATEPADSDGTDPPDDAPPSESTDSDATLGETSPDSAAKGHCAEEPIPLVFAYPGPLLNCQDYDPSADGGQISESATYFRAIVLDEPLSPGDSFAFTVQMDGTTAGTMELWGTDALCGPGLELIASAPMGQALRCLGGTIQEGPYESFIWAWFGAGTHDDIAVCPNATCPAVE